MRDFRSFLLSLCAFVPPALGDVARCLPGWEWATTKQHPETPCQLAGTLDSTCMGYSAYELGPLPPGTSYLPPQKNDNVTLGCDCNGVIYSLYMACAACQNRTTISWASWTQFCDGVQVATYPGNIPPDVTIPHWAFQDYAYGDTFDPATAEAVGDGPEIFQDGTATIILIMPTESTSKSPSSSSSPPSSSSSQISSSPTPANATGFQTSQDTQGKKSPNVTAIVTAVLGTLAFSAVVSMGACIFFRKRRGVRGGVGGVGSFENGAQTPMRLYNPSDPSTFPSPGDGKSWEVHTTRLDNGPSATSAES